MFYSVHVTLREELNSGRDKVGHFCWVVHQHSFLPSIPSVTFLCYTSIILSEESSYLRPSGICRHRWRGKFPMERQPISYLRKIHTGTDTGPARPQCSCLSTPNTAQVFPSFVFRANSFWEMNWLFVLYFPRFVASRNEIRHSNSFPWRLKPNLKLAGKQWKTNNFTSWLSHNNLESYKKL